MNIKVEHLGRGADLSPLFAVRKQVFNDEDGVPKSHDFDGRDEAAEQFVAYDGENAIGTARYRLIDDGIAKVERVAVLPGYRGKQVGMQVMTILEETAKQKGVKKLVMHSKLAAAEFYKKLGYETVGDVFEEANMPHIMMQKVIRS